MWMFVNFLSTRHQVHVYPLLSCFSSSVHVVVKAFWNIIIHMFGNSRRKKILISSFAFVTIQDFLCWFICIDSDMETAEVLIKIGLEEPSRWVWVTDDMAPNNVEERSGIDNESYVIVNEDLIVDAVANFMARCIMSNRKAQSMTPQQLQKTLKKALGGMNKLEAMLNIWSAGKLFYAFSTWGLALAGLYSSRSVLKLAALGVHTTSKVVMKAL
ncbi:unnamed protein product [Cuscuta epithymum]|uniref:Uncharacterized protein n=1 Tax=Cuscuta epithymum TaxID=186058 RepID=A0AAV0F2G9_9ASTE|nr:unnamed protein product [Cuscuta epithymum]